MCIFGLNSTYMKHFYAFIVLIYTFSVSAQVKLVTWNMENFGKSKSDAAINYMADLLKTYDIIAVQEVVAGAGGAQAVARLADELNRKGSKWDYVVSNPTQGTPYKKERYAFIWKTSVIKLKGKPWLDIHFENEIEREPFMGTFLYQDRSFTLVTFHAITKDKQPETEIKYFKQFPDLYPNLNLIFLGDFNCPQSHSVFNVLKNNGFAATLVGEKTSLKKACKQQDCLSNEFDNIFYLKRKVKKIRSQVIRFFEDFKTLKEARTISDHTPVFLEFSIVP